MAETETTRLTDVTVRVRRFYEEYSFPGYEGVDSPFHLLEKAGRGRYAALLDAQIPWTARILDSGCGTGQLVNFLSVMNRSVVGIDLSFNSLAKGESFRRRFELGSGRFVQMNLFELGLREESFDIVFSNGVLHHTADAELGFRGLVPLVKRGGFFVLGLYNTYGRFALNMRRRIFRLTGGRFTGLDFFMRQRGLEADKKRIWYMDQYEHPHEDVYSVDTALRWFRETGLEYVNSVPKINPGETFSDEERLFEPHAEGSRFDHLLAQLSWVFTQSREGGFFIIIGRRR
jgi:SAM-dependent methyltransferase